MFNTKIKNADGMFEDALYRSSHDNVTSISISRNPCSHKIRIIFTIQNKKRDKMIVSTQRIDNEEVKHYSTENITFTANKIAKWIDRIPDYIPKEQFMSWIQIRGKYEM
jgi:hypothetical protein